MKIKSLFIGLFVLFIGLIFVGCTTEESTSKTLVTLSINPEIGLFVDENNKVTDVIALNNDADILLEDVDVTGEDIEEATEVIVDESVEAGYIDSEDQDAEVRLDVESDDETQETEIKEKVKKQINTYFLNKGIFGKVSTDTLDKYGTQAEELGLSRGKTKMILLALELNPELTIDDVKDLEVSELVKLCHESVKNNNFGHELNIKFKADREKLIEKYADMFAYETQIKETEEKLADTTLTDEEKEILEAQKTELLTKYNELFAQYKEELQLLKEEYKTQKQTLKEQWKNTKENKENNCKEKNEKHQNGFINNTNKKNIEEKIKEYQNK